MMFSTILSINTRWAARSKQGANRTQLANSGKKTPNGGGDEGQGREVPIENGTTMKLPIAHWNLTLAWAWILLGFLSGAALGMGFHQEKWLGGYASHKRRLYRLAHISFFGLALMNLMFWMTTRGFEEIRPGATVAGWGFIVGALTMPVCCVVMAHWPKLRGLFVVPVASLVTAAAITLWEVAGL